MALNFLNGEARNERRNLFRYDATSNQYVFNLATKTLSAGAYQLLIDLGDVSGSNPDGVHIAYQVSGSGETDLVLMHGTVSHLEIAWDEVDGADGYLVWIKYGAGATASWDKLAIVQAPATELINTALNVDKTYVYKV